MIYRSPHPDVTVPEVALAPWLMTHFDRYGEIPALIESETGRTFTYRELGQRIRSLAAGWQAAGLSKGDVVAIYAPNSPDYAIAAHGISLAGGVFTTANPLYTQEELTHQLKDSGARRLITIRPFYEKAAGAARTLGLPEPYVIGEASFESLYAPGAPEPVDWKVREETAGLLYSSGTTGVAKGVMMTHYNMVAACTQVRSIEPGEPGETVVNFLPFFHIYGLQIIMNAFLNGGSTIVTMARFDLESYLRLTQQYRPAKAYVVPPVVIALAKSPLVDQFDLSSLRSVMAGAAPLGDDIARATEQRLSVQVRQGYGMTETSTIITTTPMNWKRDSLDCVGAPAPNMAVRLVDPATLADVAEGERGEVWCSGPNIMKGYLNKPDATAEMITPDGWLRTGDIGVMGPDGNLRIVDRVKELIKF
ncbi:MAG: AMP-binding protein, partial [Bryobacteraceae bacterium]|nr:AMP-binding protein [Bryobacteraceae bacterium]